MVPIEWAVTVQATMRVRSLSRGSRSSTCSSPSSRIRHQTILAPSRASQAAMLASWSMSVMTISSRSPSKLPIPTLTRRMKEVAFMPKEISSGR